jgi:beta-phosphoglucomutase
MPDSIAAVIFDFDGVIVHSEPLHFRAFKEAAAKEGMMLTEKQYYDELLGFDDRGAWKHLFKMHNRTLDPAVVTRLQTLKKDIVRDLIFRQEYHALPGAPEFIRGLWRNYPLAICSGALREEIEAMLEGIALRDCFSVIVAAEDVDVGKPDPRGYKLALKQLSEQHGRTIPPGKCLVVEDAPSVIENVKKEGFQTLAITTSYFADRLAMADHIVKTLQPDEVLQHLPKLKLYTGPS